MARQSSFGIAKDCLKTWRSTLKEDFLLNPFLDERMTLAVWRLGQCTSRQPGGPAFVLRRVAQVLDWAWIRGVIGAELPAQVSAGPGLRLAHGGRGVILHYTTSIGSNCAIYQQVTIGVRDKNDAATIGNNVFLGAGAKVLGEIRVADGTKVGANGVLVRDTEPGGTYVGVPAKLVKQGSPDQSTDLDERRATH